MCDIQFQVIYLLLLHCICFTINLKSRSLNSSHPKRNTYTFRLSDQSELITHQLRIQLHQCYTKILFQLIDITYYNLNPKYLMKHCKLIRISNTNISTSNYLVFVNKIISVGLLITITLIALYLFGDNIRKQL